MDGSRGRWVTVFPPGRAPRRDWVPDEQWPSPGGSVGLWHVVSDPVGGESQWEWFPAIPAAASPTFPAPPAAPSLTFPAAQAASEPAPAPTAKPVARRFPAPSRPAAVAALGLAGLAVVGVLVVQALPSTNSASPTPQPTSTPVAIDAQRLADAGVLSLSDLPSYLGTVKKHKASDEAFEQAVQTCLGLPPRSYLSRNFGYVFAVGSTTVSSNADALPSVAAARDDVAAYSGTKAADCVRTQLRSHPPQAGVTVSHISVTPVTVTVPHSDAVFALHVALTLSAQNRSITVDQYSVNPVVGQTEISVTQTVAGGTASLSDTARWAALAAARVA